MEGISQRICWNFVATPKAFCFAQWMQRNTQQGDETVTLLISIGLHIFSLCRLSTAFYTYEAILM